MHLEVEWASPGDLRVRISNAWSDETTSQEFITVGGRSLVRSSNYGGGDWIRMESPPGWVPPEEVFIPELEDAEVAEDETIDGRPMYHVTGRYEANEPPPAMSSVSQYSLFVDQETMLLRRAVIDGELTSPNLADWYPGPEPIEPIQLTQHAVYDYYDYNEPVVIESPTFDPCTRTADAKERLGCDRLPLRVYWLGDRLETPGAPDLELDGGSINYGNEDDAITEDSRLMTVYGGESDSIYLEQWSRKQWEEYLAQFSGFDSGTFMSRGRGNWWDHPCVEEEVYNEANGAEVHIFKAHLLSLVFIYPMTEAELAQCRDEPVSAVGAHVYFEDTVVEFSVQDSVSPGGPPATVSPPGSRRPDLPPYPELVLRGRNPYNNVETVRLIAAALKPYEPPGEKP